MSKKIVFREGDKVKVVNPDFFVRCGYPLTKELARQDIMKQHAETVHRAINDLIRTIDEKVFNGKKDRDNYLTWDFYVNEKIVNIVAEEYLKQNGFGGRKRSIYTERQEVSKDEVFEVIGKRTCVTGTYVPGCGGPYPEDYEPARLASPKTHVILKLRKLDNRIWHEPLEIEETNVVKYVEPEVESKPEGADLQEETFKCYEF